MARIPTLFTQLQNLSRHRVGFRVDGTHFLRPDLPPGESGMVKHYRIIRLSRPPVKMIWVFVDDRFTGIQLHPDVILDNVRVIFRNENGSDVLCVDVVPENIPSDFILRLKYIGCMRSKYWNARPVQEFDRSDSKLAVKLRSLEDDGRLLASVVDTTRTPNYVTPLSEKLKIIPEPTLPQSPPLAEKLRITSRPTSQPLSHQQKRSPTPPPSPPLDDDYCEGLDDLDDSPSDNESESLTNSDNNKVSREEANRGPVDAGERESVPGNIIGMQTRREQQPLIDRVRRGYKYGRLRLWLSFHFHVCFRFGLVSSQVDSLLFN